MISSSTTAEESHSNTSSEGLATEKVITKFDKDEESTEPTSTHTDSSQAQGTGDTHCIPGPEPLFQIETDEGITKSIRLHPTKAGRSIEVFFGNLSSFKAVYELVCAEKDENLKSEECRSDSDIPKTATTVDPESIRKLVFVGHPINSLEGIGVFTNVLEVWITSCPLQIIRWTQLEPLNHLKKLYLYDCKLTLIEPLRFKCLKMLWLAENKLTSLDFLNQGIDTLEDLNVAANDIISVSEENLRKCPNLKQLNLSGNPICVLKDLMAIRILSGLKALVLSDPLYGKCPVVCLCDSRAMLLNVLGMLATLDGKRVTANEAASIREYIHTRSLHYESEISQDMIKHVMKRRSSILNAIKHMDSVGMRIVKLMNLAARYRNTIANVEVIPIFQTAKSLMKDQLSKVEARIAKLKESKGITFKRLETVILVSRWEQCVHRWFKNVEFQSYGNFQFKVSHSVHGSNLNDGGGLFSAMLELLSAMACTGFWPQGTLPSIDTIVSLRDKGLEAGMERIHYDRFAVKDEPKFVPPEPEEVLGPAGNVMHQTGVYQPAPVVPKPVASYLPSDYEPPEPLHAFPYSIHGLPERAQPVFLWLVIPPGCASDPLGYMGRLMNERSTSFKEIRLTNCLWMAASGKPTERPFVVGIVFKVLEECLQPLHDKTAGACGKRHSHCCGIFAVNEPLSFTPAYVLAISFTQEDKNTLKCLNADSDSDVEAPAESTLSSIVDKMRSVGTAAAKHLRPTKPQSLLKKIGDSYHASFASLQIGPDGCLNPLPYHSFSTATYYLEALDGATLQKLLLTKDVLKSLTSLDLSSNRLGIIDNFNLPALKRLNLSHNNLTTLAGLPELPSLVELKVGWNSLRFLRSSVEALAKATKKLLHLELLPNPFQDIRDITHIPQLAIQSLPYVRSIDQWQSPFHQQQVPNTPSLSSATLDFNDDGNELPGFNVDAKTTDLSGKCLTDLLQLPVQVCGIAEDGSSTTLNLSNNYLTALALHEGFSSVALQPDFFKSVVRLELQENSIATLEWTGNLKFPNCTVLDLSLNSLESLNGIRKAFPKLERLRLLKNNLPCNLEVLTPIRSLSNLVSLDCSNTPLSKHPSYGVAVFNVFERLIILDGLPKAHWLTAESAEKSAGILTPEWLENKLGTKEWQGVTELSLENCGLQKISLPAQSLGRLVSLDLRDNYLDSLGNLSSMAGLKVLCVSHNNIISLGGYPCPICYSHTAESFANKARGLAAPLAANSGTGLDPFGMPIAGVSAKSASGNDPQNPTSAWGFSSNGSDPNQSNNSNQANRKMPKSLFPKLEVLILSHNGLNSLMDLHLHSMPNLETVVLKCNNLSNFQGLNNIPTLRAVVLDHNKIKEVPANTLSGCPSLKYLHLEHNKITSLPRMPHLHNLNCLYLAHNRIQSLTDSPVLVAPSLAEVSLYGNPISGKHDYFSKVATRYSHVQVLDGRDLAIERLKLRQLERTTNSSSSTNNLQVIGSPIASASHSESSQLQLRTKVLNTQSVSRQNSVLSKSSKSK